MNSVRAKFCGGVEFFKVYTQKKAIKSLSNLMKLSYFFINRTQKDIFDLLQRVFGKGFLGNNSEGSSFASINSIAF